MTHTKHTEAREAAFSAFDKAINSGFECSGDVTVVQVKRNAINAAIGAYLSVLSSDGDGRVKEIRDRHSNRQASIDRDEDFYWSRELAPGTDEYTFIKRPNVRVTHCDRGNLLTLLTTLQAGNARLREALERIAGLNNLEGVPDDEVLSALSANLYQAEIVARGALELETKS